MFSSASPSLSDIAAVTGNSRDGGSWGDGNGWWVLIILFALFGWGRGGFGGQGGESGGSCCTPATCADLQRGFDNQTTQQRFNGIDQGLCSLGYDNATLINGVNQNISATGNGIQQAITQSGIDQMQSAKALSRQLADCCCENRAAIAQVRYDMATDTCAIQNTIQSTTRDVIDNDNANFRAIMDKFCDLEKARLQEKIDDQASQIQALNLAVSQRNQNDYLVNQLRPCPTPAYITCNPWATNGTAYNGCCGGYNSGCGC